MLAAIWGTRSLIADEFGLAYLVLLILLGVACYMGMAALTERFLGYGLRRAIGPVFSMRYGT